MTGWPPRRKAMWWWRIRNAFPWGRDVCRWPNRTHALRGAVKVFLWDCRRLRKGVEQGGTTAVERLEIDGLIRRGTILPTPQEETNPLARQRTHGGLGCFPLVTLLLGIDLRPAGMPDRCGGALDERVPQELWSLEASVHPGLLAAAFGHRRDPRIFLQCGGGIAFPLCAEGDEQPGGADGACPGEGLAQGASGMVWRALRDGGIKGRDRLQGNAELGDKGLDEHGMRGDHALVDGQGGRGLDGVEALGHNVHRAPVVVAEEGFQRGAPCELRRFAGRPAAQKVAENGGVFVLEPVQHMGERVFQGAREAVGDPPGIRDHAAAVFDELVARAAWDSAAGAAGAGRDG